MSQQVPSLIFHAQALKVINELRDAYQVGIGTIDDLVAQLRDALNGFQNTVGLPFFDFEPVVEGEPPLSNKINRLWNDLQKDINLLQQQADIGRASTIFTHNLIVTEVLQAQQANARVTNKLKTLQLYSKSVDSSIVTFGDHFSNDEFVDLTLVPSGQRAVVLGQSYVTLGQQGELFNLSKVAAPSVLPTSNGFLGNIHEVTGETRTVTFTGNATPIYDQTGSTTGAGGVARPGTPGVGSVLVNTGLVTFQEAIFKAETSTRSDLFAVIDDEKEDNDPTTEDRTWIEYEYCRVFDSDRQFAGNFNFEYDNDVTGVGTLDWATGPPDGVLRLDLELDLKSIENINYITYKPFSLENNANHPVKVVYVQTSSDRTNWDVVTPQNVYVSSTANLQLADIGQEIVLGDAIWAFAGRPVRYIRFRIEQAHPIECKIGHLWYQDDKNIRVKGPNPVLTRPARPYDPNVRTVSFSNTATAGANQLLQQREVFNGERWVIGIRGILVNRINHVPESTLVTKPLRVGGTVDRVTLDADVSIPPEYDDSQRWVSFYVSPDDGANWYPIARVQDDSNNIPEMVAFNDPLPAAFQESGVGYYTTASAVQTLRLKAVLKRPSSLPSTTPVLHGYTLKVKKRS